uniref:Uncharacterized protein n=1 Tax=Populus alba TaxID=43335 RepID=A0A4U5QWY7_POPAL|nr:hypothetical protein D5086_0000035170 [Populus alba]
MVTSLCNENVRWKSYKPSTIPPPSTPIDFQQLAQQIRALTEAILATQQIKAFPIHPPPVLRQHACSSNTSRAPAAPFHVRNWEKQNGRALPLFLKADLVIMRTTPIQGHQIKTAADQ